MASARTPGPPLPRDVIKSGWLLRQSTVLKRWKKSWFILWSSGRISYYETELSGRADDFINVPLERPAILDYETLGDNVGNMPEGLSEPQCIFGLKSGDKLWILCADNPDEALAWRLAIDEAYGIQMPRAPLHYSTPYYPPNVAYGYNPYFTSTGAPAYSCPPQNVVYVELRKSGCLKTFCFCCFSLLALEASEDLPETYAEVKQRAQDLPKTPKVNPHAVFANNELDLSAIDAFGFDYDYTLAVYKKEVNTLIYGLALDILIEDGKYPPGIRQLHYDPEFAIRGLHYDINRGVLLKLDAFCQIQLGTVHRGKTALSNDAVFELYGGTYVPREYVEPLSGANGDGGSMKQLLDLFSLPEIGLLSNVTDYFVQNNIRFDTGSLFSDVKQAIRAIHLNGRLYSSILANLPKCVHLAPALREFLRSLRARGKVVFLLTNSPFPFVNAGMKYLVGGGHDWKELFDVIIVKARKPAFFQRGETPFRRYNVDTDRLDWHPVTILKPGTIYAEGNMKSLLSGTCLHGKSVLYVGDHMYSDLAEPMLKLGWKTAAIVPELSREIRIINSDDYRSDLNWYLALTSLIEAKHDQLLGSSEGLRILKDWKDERHGLMNRAKAIFNPNFGSVFRTYTNPTYFTRRFVRLADVYTSDVGNFLEYDGQHKFYPRRFALPHEPQIVVL